MTNRVETNRDDWPLWRPGNTNETLLSAFASKHQIDSLDYLRLHELTITDLAWFWDAVWDFCGVIGTKGDMAAPGGRSLVPGGRSLVPGGRSLVNDGDMLKARFFPDARLNFSENLLAQRNGVTKNDDAIVFWGEDKVKNRLSWGELYDLVSRCHQALLALGIKPGDRVAAIMANMPEAVIAMLGVASIGAIWSSCSPDFGVEGVLERFRQIEPKVLVVCDGYWYNGKQIAIEEKLGEICGQLTSLKAVIVVDYLGRASKILPVLGDRGVARVIGWDKFLAPFSAEEIAFHNQNFDHPLAILFSSGTTGVPKCIVHGCGGVLLQHLKEHQLQSNIKAGDRVFYFTTCGWMMWNWLVSSLASGATILLYDGSPLIGKGEILFDYAEAEQMTFLGISAQYLGLIAKMALSPRNSHRLDHLRTIASTGSPLVGTLFDYVYDHIKRDVHLASISGGSDIVSCFVLGNPNGAVWRGEIQAKGLGMAVEVWDDDGKAKPRGKGELVCVKPFPSMPVMFWNDPEGVRYRNAYFSKFANVWHHGDFAEFTCHDGIIIHGRSDATLNPGGVRIGTAEIYAQVEKVGEVLESVAIGQKWQGDVRVILFVRLKGGIKLDDDLIARIRIQIRTGASPRHVPAKVIQVADIPKTKSGKIVELAVTNMVHGLEVHNKSSLANPEALGLFSSIDALQVGFE